MFVRSFLLIFAVTGILSASAHADVAIAPWSASWNEGAQDCAAHPSPPLEVHQYDAKTFVLREALCATWEAPFMYLLIGDRRALLIDTGDVADPRKMPLAQTVEELLARSGSSHLPLLVVHTHRHLDHRAGDPQFAQRKAVQLVGYDLESVKRFFGFADWPNGIAHIDLGRRVVDVIPTPGHNETHVAFYDRNTALLFSGDFLMPGRLLIADTAADVASAARVAEFVRNKPVRAVLGGHVEVNENNDAFEWESTYHPREHALGLTKADVLGLPAALAKFNSFYRTIDHRIMIDPVRDLLAAIAVAFAVFAMLLTAVILGFRRWRNREARAGTAQYRNHR
jgi:hydroxyacylglutathione hydrolase